MRRTTEVILTHNIVGLGAESDQVKVSPGYARNYLLPQGFAITLTSANKRRIEALRQRRAEREAHELNTMTELSKSLAKLTCIIKVKTGDDGKMFGSVTNGTIADELKHQFDVTLDKKKIVIEDPIRGVGDYDVQLHLHPEVKTTLKVRVESTTPLPPPEEAEAKGRGPRGEGRGEEGQRTEKRGRRFTEGRPPRAERTEKGEKPAKAEKAEKPEKPAKAEKAEKTEKPAKAEKAEKPAKAEKAEKPAKTEKA